MKSEILSHNNNRYLKIELEQIIQKEQSFYLGKVKASDFVKIYTVRPAEYDFKKHSSLAQSFPEDLEYYQHLINEDKTKINEKDFQRDADPGRINSIVGYLSSEEYAFFPNTIIANCELINDWEFYQITEDNSFEEFLELTGRPDFLSFLQKQNEKFVLFIPFIPGAVLVIDGQHRLEGIRKSDQVIQDKYDLVIAFIIGYDRSVIAKQFYTINYEQKPVNKSLLYQLTGEFSRELNELSFMHHVVKLLNELPDSPFNGRVKMLGKTPKNLSVEAKRRLSISQAFLIDSMIRFVSAKAKGTLYPPIFLKYFKDSSQHVVIIRSLARYFSAVQKIKPDWETPDQSLVSKGMGIGALLKVFNFLFQVMFLKELNRDWNRLDSLKVEQYVGFLNGLANVDFSSNGPYGKTGSEGSINKIKNDIISNLQYFGAPQDTKAFENNFKSSTLQIFNDYLLSV